MKTIIELAREAGLTEPSHPYNPWGASNVALERFAQLVRDQERERCARIVERWGDSHGEGTTVNASNMGRKLAYAVRAGAEKPAGPQDMAVYQAIADNYRRDDTALLRQALDALEAEIERLRAKPEVPHFRGYALLGAGMYLINASDQGEPAELIISVATDAEREGRVVGDLRDNTPGRVIQPEDMAVRLGFTGPQGLDALEQHLRILRQEHFPDTVANPDVNAALLEALRECGESCSIFDVRSIVRAAIESAGKAKPEPLECPDAAHMGEHACVNRSQCWEPCGALGKSAENVVAKPEPLTDADIDRIADAVPVDQLGVHITTWHRRFARAVLSAAPAVREPKPFTKAQLHRLYVNSPELHKDAPSEAAFTRIVQLAEAAHNLGGRGE